MWTNDSVRMLIDFRKVDNVYFHQLRNKQKGDYWQDLAFKINLRFSTSFTGKQAAQKFQDIRQDFKVNKYLFNIRVIISTNFI